LQFFSWSEAAIIMLSLSQMQQQRTEVEAVFRNEILCQKCYGILQVFEWFCVRNTEEIKGQVIHIKKI